MARARPSDVRGLKPGAAALVTVMATASAARAAPPPAPAPVPEARAQGGAPAPRKGFQMAFRTGVMAPLGDATGAPGDSLARRYAWQVPFLVDLGAKITESLFVGGYLGLGFGDEGNDRRVDGYCDDNDDDLENDVACITYTARIGLEAQWHFRPGASANPWVSYGFGWARADTRIDDHIIGRSEETALSGLEFARLGAGLDLRPSRVAGLGPFAELSLGRFTSSETKVNGTQTYRGDAGPSAVHAWLTLGLRFVLFP